MTDNRNDSKPRNDAEQSELDEWKRWAESWIHEMDGTAGEEGTDELVNNYKKVTPGQNNEHDSR